MIRTPQTEAPYAPRMLITILAALLAAGSLTLTIPAFATAAPQASSQRGAAPECAAGVDFLGFSDALDKRTFEGTSVGGLSALTYDQRRGVYYSLVDNGPKDDAPARFYTLGLPTESGELGEPEILGVTTLKDGNGQPFTASNFDGEGISLTKRGELLISSETEPSIRRFSLDGTLLGELPVPQKFRVAPEGQAQSNKTFESLSLSPNGRSLFTAVEGPLASDGSSADGENRIRLLRYDDRGPGGFEPAEEFFYLTEPDQGVTEVVALSEDKLLVLERGFVSGEGNTVRVFEVSLRGAKDVSDQGSLAATELEPVQKELLVDVAGCPSAGATTPGTQEENPLLDNYESLALGPRLSGGQRALLLQSDDNFNDAQVTRVVALGIGNLQATGHQKAKLPDTGRRQANAPGSATRLTIDPDKLENKLQKLQVQEQRDLLPLEPATASSPAAAPTNRSTELQIARQDITARPVTRISSKQYEMLYRKAARDYGFSDDWYILAAVGKVESDHSRNLGPSSAGAMGPMQFLPSTWEAYGLDGNGDGVANILDPEDAIPAAASYLRAGGAPEDWYAALYTYNRADWYVKKVLGVAKEYRGLGGNSIVGP